MNGAGNCGSESQYFSYCLVGFGSFLDFKTIEFSKQLPDAHICDNCGAVSGQVTLLPCMHVTCKRCCLTKYNSSACITETTCALDKNVFHENLPTKDVRHRVNERTVRCPNSAHGCNHTCTLRELGDHFPQCKFLWTNCSLCGTRIPFQKLPDHYAYGRSLLPSAATALAKSKQLIQDLTNATKEVEEAVTEKSRDQPELRQKMDSVLEVLGKLRVQVENANP